MSLVSPVSGKYTGHVKKPKGDPIDSSRLNYENGDGAESINHASLESSRSDFKLIVDQMNGKDANHNKLNAFETGGFHAKSERKKKPANLTNQPS